MTYIISASISVEAGNKLEARMKATGKKRSEYLQDLIIKDYSRSMSPQIEAGKTYAQVIEDAERRVAELRLEEAKHKKEDALIFMLQTWFESHSQEWRETIITRFMDGKAVFAKTYWDIVKVQKLFEELYKTNDFFWTHSLTELELRQLISSAMKEAD